MMKDSLFHHHHHQTGRHFLNRKGKQEITRIRNENEEEEEEEENVMKVKGE